MRSLTLWTASVIAWFTMLIIVLAVLISAVYGSTTPNAHPQSRTDVRLAPIPREHLRGHWVMGADNHAYWCWGPNVVLGSWNEMPRAYALDCEGSHSMVLLHD